MIIPTSAPADEGFEGYQANSGSSSPAPTTLGGFVYAADGGCTTYVTDVVSYNVTVGDGQVLFINPEAYGVSWFEIHSSSLANNFKLVSMMIESGSTAWGFGETYTVTGYDGGSGGTLLASDTINFGAADSSGSITYAKNAAAEGGILSFDASWQNVDTIRFTLSGGGVVQVSLDNIDISAAVGPTILGATYDAASGVLTATGANMATGARIDVSALSLTGQDGGTYALTSADVGASSTTAFSVTLNAADRLAVNGLLNKAGTSAVGGTTYNLAAAAGWTANASADASGNGVTVANVSAPTITSATYDAASHVLSVTGTNLVGTFGANNDITVAKLALVGEGGASVALTGASVEVSSATSFSVTLAGSDRSLVEQLFNKNGASSTGGTAYSLVAADDWNSVVANADTADAGSPVTVSNVAAPAITSATYDAATGMLAVSGTGLLQAAGAANDIDAGKFTLTGQGGASYTLVDTASVELTSGTGFTLALGAADRAGVAALLDRAGTLSSGGTSYNLGAAANWDAGDAAGSADLAGNGVSVSNVTHPAVASIQLSDTTLKAGDSAAVTIVFSEAVSGFTAADVTVANGSLGALASADGGVTWSATFTPDADVADATNVLTVDATGVINAAGYAGIGAASSANYSIDTQRPAASITLADNVLAAGETALVTIAFQEAVSGFTNADLAVANGTLGAVSSADGGVTWTATFTPGAGMTAASNVITLDNAGVIDAAGNVGAGISVSNNYAIDTVRPTATASVDQAVLPAGASTTVTIQFSEPVAGFGYEDIAADQASVTQLASSDGGRTWTALLTAAASLQGDANTVRVDTTGVHDAAGNAGQATAVSNTYGTAAIAIDGTTVTLIHGTDPATGLAVDTLIVPVVGAGRVDDPSSAHPGLADIPLGIGDPAAGASATLTVSLPAGTGLTAQGPVALLAKDVALLDLTARIDAHTGAGSPARADIADLAGAFLASLPDGVGIETTTLTPGAGAVAPAQPIAIAGAPVQDGAAVALVIDATQLPAATVLTLDNIDFAAVMGAASVRGGAGNSHVAGDGAAQDMFLGAGDDELHGGGGNDVLGGGRDDTGQWQFFIDAGGQVTARHEAPRFAPGSWESVAGTELDAGAGGLHFLDAPGARLQELALLYHAAFGRAADLGGLEFWAANGAGAGDIMTLFTQQAEYQAGPYAGLDNDAFVHAVYQNVLGRAPDADGLAYWVGTLSGVAPVSRAAVLADIALSGEHRAVLGAGGGFALAAGTVAQPAQWFAGSGNDVLDGGAGNDTLVGGDGIDTVVYGGARSQYHMVLGSDGAVRIVDSANGDVDRILGIELGKFADGTADLGFTQASPAELQTLGLLYHALFDRAADLAGINWWVAHASGDTLQLAQAMAGSDEFKARYEGLDDAAFVQALFDHSGLQAGAAGGSAWWQDYLHTHTRAETVAAWVGNAEVVGAGFGADGLWLA